jgi:hypothetical protein
MVKNCHAWRAGGLRNPVMKYGMKTLITESRGGGKGEPGGSP